MKYNLKEIYDNRDEFKDLLSIPGYLIYMINNSITNEKYIGDTKIDLKWRLFDHPVGAHFKLYECGHNRKLYRAMRKYGIENFTIEILYTGRYDENIEGEFIDKYDSFKHGYNNNKSGKYGGWDHNNLGRINVFKDGITRSVLPEELEEYLLEGYKLGRCYDILLGRISITDGKHMKFIEPNDDIPEGWHKGSLGNMKDYVWIHDKSGNRTRVSKDKLDDYLNNGWYLGSNYNTHPTYIKRCWVNNGINNRMIPEDKLKEFLNNHPDYKLGRLYIK